MYIYRERERDNYITNKSEIMCLETSGLLMLTLVGAWFVAVWGACSQALVSAGGSAPKRTEFPTA